MSVINVTDIAYIRTAVPDIAAQHQFLDDFGLIVEEVDGVLYARGTDPSPYCFVNEVGEAGLVALGFEAGTAADLATFATAVGTGVETLSGPGGGSVARTTDPDGNRVEVVHGREPVEPGEVVGAEPFNRGSDRPRLGVRQRVPQGPARVKRLGHCVLFATDFARSREWYREHLGFVDSDQIYAKDESNVILSFMRCGLGATFTDHHTLAIAGAGQASLEHAAFEVEDFDAVMTGHDHLRGGDYEHARGPGRHVLGAQVFDYWYDASGQMVEHFADGDLMNQDNPAGLESIGVALGTQWGSMDPAT